MLYTVDMPAMLRLPFMTSFCLCLSLSIRLNEMSQQPSVSNLCLAQLSSRTRLAWADWPILHLACHPLPRKRHSFWDRTQWNSIKWILPRPSGHCFSGSVWPTGEQRWSELQHHSLFWVPGYCSSSRSLPFLLVSSPPCSVTLPGVPCGETELWDTLEDPSLLQRDCGSPSERDHAE